MHEPEKDHIIAALTERFPLLAAGDVRKPLSTRGEIENPVLSARLTLTSMQSYNLPQQFLRWLRQAVRRSWRLLSWLLQLLVFFVIPVRAFDRSRLKRQDVSWKRTVPFAKRNGQGLAGTFEAGR